VAQALAAAQRPVLVAGTDVWLSGAAAELVALAETVGAPTVCNGMGRGTVPAGHPQAVSRARGDAFARADLVVVVGTPLDFRLGFGRFGDAEVVHVMDAPESLAGHAPLRAGISGHLPASLARLAETAGGPTGELAAAREAFRAEIGYAERDRRAGDTGLLAAETDPIHPARVMGALGEVLDRDAVVIGDGGDFVSFAGKYVDSHTPGCWLDPGPYGCLGTGMGYAAAARLAHPDRQVVCLLGDGAAGLSLADVDTLVRHELPVVIVVGNNGAWALEKYPMQQIYDGWDAAADLQPGTRYDRVAEAFGAGGETVEKPGDLAPALRRGLDAGVPYVINARLDPSVAYPRSTLLA
jgi:acetolactate synthase-1/2/3 large subunit